MDQIQCTAATSLPGGRVSTPIEGQIGDGSYLRYWELRRIIIAYSDVMSETGLYIVPPRREHKGDEPDVLNRVARWTAHESPPSTVNRDVVFLFYPSVARNPPTAAANTKSRGSPN